MQPAQRALPPSANQKQRRATIACTACRQSKIKCSGDEPCVNCRRRLLKCQFSEGNNKILVSERYLRGLQKQAYNWQRATGVKRPREECFRFDEDTGTSHPVNESGAAEELLGPRPEGSPVPPAAELSCNIWTSPFTLPTTVFKNAGQEQRKWIWLAPFSPWSLTARLIVMLTDKLHPDSANSLPQLFLDGEIYPLVWDQVKAPGPPNTSDLPSLDYALYLFQIVRFRLGQAYRFFEEDSFVSQIHRFYDSRLSADATEPRFWFVQFLMVLALGNAFIARPRNQKDPAGSKYFVRAMSAMPTNISTGKDSLLAIEALALVGLYLYAIDHREASHVHVGHAIRIAQLEGMHTQLPEEVLGATTVARCRNLWWSLYILDRHFSPSLGLPVTLQDSDITTLINPLASNLQNMTFSLQVRITRMFSFIIGTIYKTEKTPLATFLDITRGILETMAKYAEEIENMINVNFHGSRDNVPKEMRHTILQYHQCVIAATRPLLLSVLKERLEKLGRAEEDWQKFLALPKSLISTGIKSAEKTLQIIGDENGLLETFLPFDLEMTYAAALYLTLSNALFFPSSADTDRAYSRAAHEILDELVLSGNRVAGARKRELTRIEGLFQEFARRVEQEGLRLLTLSDQGLPDATQLNVDINTNAPAEMGLVSAAALQTPSSSSNAASTLFHGHGHANPSSVEPVDSAPAPASVEFLESIGISSYEFLSIVEQIDHPGISVGELDVRPDLLGPGDGTGSFG
ncbi:Zn(II)2Cys6 transcription factor [Aspergillus puulaauensis]|uniref:Zn(2)-C6 fungal-type domain-containing protein n=1 Tax=Aspergillus puulaauensis TaxID=1220207 RepID=A0A7R7XN45_9EURO|nr:uncharacterized protein APUU_40357A [Aspergillus puulaauensis]BCS23913.1 hypothetical protein APUU_40357A [Aspergillus puulaauensis]